MTRDDARPGASSSGAPSGDAVVADRASADRASAEVDPALAVGVASALRAAGARFGLVFGSRARGDHDLRSDLDVAAWWGGDPPHSWDVELPPAVDLVVLDRAPLELAGRIALEGVLLFDDDPPARVRWVADTRKIWLDERPRVERSHREFLEAAARGR